MHIGLFDYPLRRSLIAQFPAAERTASRLLRVPSKGAAAGGRDASGAGANNPAQRKISQTQSGQTQPNQPPFSELKFSQIGRLLRPGDLLVANNPRVVPARLYARKPTGGRVEIMLERILGDHTARVQLRANKPIHLGQEMLAGGVKLLVRERCGRFFVIECERGVEAAALFTRHGTTPLPPYIERAARAADRERYQTVYSRVDGAVAAPTAGLHFDRALIDTLADAGVDWATVTLHVGAGTFAPLDAAALAARRMHREWVEVGPRTVAQIDRAKARGGRVIAVGTTVVRAVESAAQSGRLTAFCGDTDLFIVPGYRFRVVDALITNFHLPRSTLLMMVCAFAGHRQIMRAYRHAMEHDFRFYSYGDAMFVERADDGCRVNQVDE